VHVRSDVSVIGAFVVKETAAILDAPAVKAFAASHLAEYKVPREVIFVDAIPRTRNGKVQRKKLAAIFDAAMRNAQQAS
jgi:acyl-coenzyme A synthetase/AMP-(fatty) acid ligase